MAWIAVAAVAWGLLGPFGAYLLAEGLHPTEVAFWRAAFGGAAFLAHARIARDARPLRPRDVLGTVAFAVVGVTLFYVALIEAIDRGGISLAFVLLYTAPAWVVALSGPVLGERPDRRRWALAAGAMAGVALVASGQGEGVHATPDALAWGLAAGFAYASYYLLGKRLQARQSTVRLYATALLVGAAGIAPFVVWSAKSPTAWALLAAVALVSTYGAYLAYGVGLARTESSRAVVVATIEPVVAGALAWTLFGERLGALGLLGAGVVLACAAASGLATRRTSRDVPVGPGGA